MARGLGRVVVQLHSARVAAHDFVAGMTGAARRAILAVRTCLETGLDVEAEVAVTRPTATHLGETVEVLRRLGVERVHVRWLLPGQVETNRVLALVPRLLPQMRYVAAATKLAAQLGVELSLAGVPECLRATCGRVAPPRCADEWVLPGAGNGDSPRVSPCGPGLLAACQRCAGAYACPGAPADYVRTFGWLEIDVAAARRPR
jgi:MoaA/NifB/PqqE/SkfB family radical SAM enzyme